MKLIKKFTYILFIFLISLSMVGCQLTNNQSGNTATQKEFDQFIQNEFTQAMESDYIGSHIYMENPKDFGVDQTKITVQISDRITDKSQQESREELQKTSEQFSKFKREDLTPEQQDTYDIYRFHMDIDLELSNDKFDYYQQLFETMSGLHVQLPLLLSDWQLRNEQDVKDLILLIKDIDPYMQSTLAYAKEQAKRGLLMINKDGIADYCDQILEKGMKSSVLNAMITEMKSLSLDAEKTKTYTQQLTAAFQDSFLAAYQNIKTTIKSIPNSQINSEGYAQFKYGKDYYNLILQKSIGSNKSANDVKAMMKKTYKDHLFKLSSAIMRNPDLVDKIESVKTNYTSYQNMLDDIYSQFFNDFPETKNNDYHIEDISKDIATSGGISAYFKIPAIDSTQKKQIRVNPNINDISSLSTYKTIAHEGFPGHMYQYNYVFENLTSPYRKVIASNNAYTEGFAVYAADFAFRYLKDIPKDVTSLFQKNELASYELIIIADIGIHYDGWSLKKFQTEMNTFGYKLNDNDAKTLYSQLQANPSAFQPYYVGYEEIIALKEKAQEALGSDFNETRFHTALLESGNATWDVVTRHIETYIKDK